MLEIRRLCIQSVKKPYGRVCPRSWQSLLVNTNTYVFDLTFLAVTFSISVLCYGTEKSVPSSDPNPTLKKLYRQGRCQKGFYHRWACREWTLYRYCLGDGKAPRHRAQHWFGLIVTATCHVIKLFVRCFNQSKTPEQYSQHICLDIVNILLHV